MAILSELRQNGHYITATNLVQKLSEEMRVPASTLRYNIRQLASYGLLTCGDAKTKGVPIRLTDECRLIMRIIGGDKND